MKKKRIFTKKIKMSAIFFEKFYNDSEPAAHLKTHNKINQNDRCASYKLSKKPPNYLVLFFYQFIRTKKICTNGKRNK